MKTQHERGHNSTQNEGHISDLLIHDFMDIFHSRQYLLSKLSLICNVKPFRDLFFYFVRFVLVRQSCDFIQNTNLLYTYSGWKHICSLAIQAKYE